MTKKQLGKLVERNLKENPNLMIDTETGLEALQKVVSFAASREINWALVGGIAMHLYGSLRLTKDVDVIASAKLSLEAERSLGFGGERYLVKVGKKNVPVDWIVRNDTARKFYEQALKDANELFGIPIITPEWLVILKYIAGRFKDQQDAVYLLKQKNLVNRRSIRRKIIETVGDEFWALVAVGLKRWYDLADGRITTEKEDYEAERL
ncbi:hypothetical protein BH24ACI1_BH24ACI1_24990 [soil metagenome]|jgi:hypothetical protein